jgi:hypothetical protein
MKGGLWKFLGPLDNRKDTLAKLSTLLLIGALALELVCLVRTNQLSGLVIGSLDERSTEAMNKSAKALGDSTLAITQSGTAQIASARAVSQSGAAVIQSSKALKEADSFEADISVAKKQAAEAESHLAEAVSMARAEEAELLKLEARLADRTITPEQEARLISRLSPIHGITVDVVTWGDTSEIHGISIRLLNLLSRAGWSVIPAQPIGESASVKGILIGLRPGSDANTDRAATALLSAVREAGLVADPWPFEQLRLPLQRSGFSVGMAPIRMFIGSKP